MVKGKKHSPVIQIGHFWKLRSLLLFCLLTTYCHDGIIRTNGTTPTNPLIEGNSAIASEPQNLVGGRKISGVISAGQEQIHALSLEAGQYVSMKVSKGDLQISLSICSNEDQFCFEALGQRFGTLDISFLSDVPATYRVVIKSLETDPQERRYELQVGEILAAKPQHRLAAAATRIIAEADKLRGQPTESSQLAAVVKYREAHRLWVSARESGRAAEALCAIGDVYFTLSQYQSSLAQYSLALSISQFNGDEAGVLAALNGIGYTNIYLGDNQKALSYATKMLDIVARTEPIRRSAAQRRAEAQALNTIGEANYSFGELRRSIEFFERALSLHAEVGERDGQALDFLNLGYSHSDLGDVPKASEYYERSLALFQSIGNGRGAALAQTALGGLHSLVGEEQTALDMHKKACDYFRKIGNKQGEAAALNGVARAYQNLNEYEAAYNNYYHALRLYEAIGNRDFTALNKFLIGRILFQKGDIEQALKFYQESLDLSRLVGDRVIEAHSLKGLGTIQFSRGDIADALARFSAALEIYRKLGNRRSEAYVLNDIGHIQTYSHNLDEAVEILQRALGLMRDTADRHGEALTLFNIAKIERERGNLFDALSLIQNSITIGESLRTKINNSQLRTSYFASVHEQYELCIDVLMLLHARYPDRGYAVAALLASERARSRSLLDSLLTERIAPGSTPSADLLSKQQELLRTLDEKAESQTRLLAGKYSQQDAAKLSQEIGELTIEYQNVRSNIREQSPERAVLTQPDQVRAEDLQNLVKGGDTILLEFALGDDRSYLWEVSDAEIRSYELPNRATIEDLGRKVYESITVRQSINEQQQVTEQDKKLHEADEEYRRQSVALSKMLLGPVVSRIGSKRLLIVGDGVLRHIPFEALPLPDSSTMASIENGIDPEPLVSAHEVVILPSALTLVAVRRQKNEPDIARKTITIIADPVFEKDDPRVLAGQRGNASIENEDGSVYLSTALRDFNDNGFARGISRLPSTLREANTIMDFIPSGDGVMTTGFAATKQRFKTERMNDYRILHLATHGLLNTEHPELSGIILSLVDERGNSVNGFLRLHDIYGLDLTADLVVLSACRTGLGKNIQGEGVVGLSSGFMYAGAKSVVASLWKVDDNATAEFMSYFYAAMLKEGLPPAEALRFAKLKMRKQERWRAPFYWAGFVLQGEYENEIVFRNRMTWKQPMIITAFVVLLVAGYYVYLRHERGLKVNL